MHTNSPHALQTPPYLQLAHLPNAELSAAGNNYGTPPPTHLYLNQMVQNIPVVSTVGSRHKPWMANPSKQPVLGSWLCKSLPLVEVCHIMQPLGLSHHQQ